jgi:hypothetical protein
MDEDEKLVDIMNADRDTVLEELPHQRVRVITDLILKHWFSCDDLRVVGWMDSD